MNKKLEENLQNQVITLRLTKAMRDELKKVADNEHRPLSNQAVYFIAKGLKEYKNS